MEAKFLVDRRTGSWAINAPMPVGMGLAKAPRQALRQITGVTA